jgi:hypothetical protein
MAIGAKGGGSAGTIHHRNRPWHGKKEKGKAIGSTQIKKRSRVNPRCNLIPPTVVGQTPLEETSTTTPAMGVALASACRHDALLRWYVSNVSIIFDAPSCLCTICFVFCYTSWHFYAFSETNLLTRCHSASSLFSAVLCFGKVTQEIFLKLDETKAEVPIFLDMRQSPKQRRRGARGWPHHAVARVTPWPRRAMVWAPGPPPDITLPPTYSPRWDNPRGLNSFPENILQAAAVVNARSGGSRSSSRHPVGEGNHHRRPSSSPCLLPEWCVSSVPWTTGP